MSPSDIAQKREYFDELMLRILQIYFIGREKLPALDQMPFPFEGIFMKRLLSFWASWPRPYFYIVNIQNFAVEATNLN